MEARKGFGEWAHYSKGPVAWAYLGLSRTNRDIYDEMRGIITPPPEKLGPPHSRHFFFAQPEYNLGAIALGSRPDTVSLIKYYDQKRSCM